MRLSFLKEIKRNRLSFAVALIAVLFVVVAGLYFRNKLLDSAIPAIPEKSTSPTPTKQQYPIDTENDGVYTNDQFGFKFEYPPTVFVTQSKEQANHIVWYSKQGALTPFDVGEDGVWMVVSYGYATPELKNKIARLESLKVGELSSIGVKMISTQKKSNYEQVIYFYKTPSDNESEQGVSYASEWIIDGKVYLLLNISSAEESTLNKYKNLFEKILGTFEFFTPTNKLN